MSTISSYSDVTRMAVVPLERVGQIEYVCQKWRWETERPTRYEQSEYRKTAMGKFTHHRKWFDRKDCKPRVMRVINRTALVFLAVFGLVVTPFAASANPTRLPYSFDTYAYIHCQTINGLPFVGYNAVGVDWPPRTSLHVYFTVYEDRTAIPEWNLLGKSGR